MCTSRISVPLGGPLHWTEARKTNDRQPHAASHSLAGPHCRANSYRLFGPFHLRIRQSKPNNNLKAQPCDPVSAFVCLSLSLSLSLCVCLELCRQIGLH